MTSLCGLGSPSLGSHPRGLLAWVQGRPLPPAGQWLPRPVGGPGNGDSSRCAQGGGPRRGTRWDGCFPGGRTRGTEPASFAEGAPGLPACAETPSLLPRCWGTWAGLCSLAPEALNTCPRPLPRSGPHQPAPPAHATWSLESLFLVLLASVPMSPSPRRCLPFLCSHSPPSLLHLSPPEGPRAV